jgi:hypothetical protein
VADFMVWPAASSYAFISMIATLHHLPFVEALTRAARLLEPGGVLGVIGLDRAHSLLHASARNAIAFPVSYYYRATRRTSVVGAPIRDPHMTLEEIRRQAIDILPGAVILRHVLWRYSLVWAKPAALAARLP